MASLHDIERINTNPELKRYIRGLETLNISKNTVKPTDSDEVLLSNYFWSGYGMFLYIQEYYNLLFHYKFHRWHPIDQAKVYLELENRLYKMAYRNGLAFNQETTGRLLALYKEILTDKETPKPISKLVSARMKIIKNKHRRTLGLESSSLYEFPLLYHTGLEISPTEIIKMGKQEINRLVSLLLKLDKYRDLTSVGSPKKGLAILRETIMKSSQDTHVEKVLDNGIPPNTFSPDITDFVEDVSYVYDKKYSPYKVFVHNHKTLLSDFQTPISESVIYNKTIPGEHLRYSTNPDYLVNTLMKEGWNAYAESLPTPLNPVDLIYSNLFHTVAMVVDASIHTGLLTRADAVEYFKKYTILSVKEIDRVLSECLDNPGYYVCAKLGRSLIEDYRNKLGESISAPEFHSMVLSSRTPGGLAEKFLDYPNSGMVKSLYVPIEKSLPRQEHVDLIDNAKKIHKTSTSDWVTWFLVVSSTVIVLLLVVVVVLLFLNFFKVGPRDKNVVNIKEISESETLIP